jgi:hypothetical protein
MPDFVHEEEMPESVHEEEMPESVHEEEKPESVREEEMPDFVETEMPEKMDEDFQERSSSLSGQPPSSQRSLPEGRGQAHPRDPTTDPERNRPTRRQPTSESRSGEAALTPRSLPEPRGVARPRETDPAEDRPTWKPFGREDSDADTGDDSGDGDSDRLWSEPWSDGWEELLEDEFRFFDGVFARKEAPDPEYFVSDHSLADFYVATQRNEVITGEIELELPKEIAH